MNDVIYFAELVTRSFEFRSFGRTRDEAMNAMRDTWERHVERTGAGDTFAELVDDVAIFDVQIGKGYVR